MKKEDDRIMLIDDEIPNMHHVISKKTGELGIIYKPEGYDKYVFKQTDPNKFLKTYHLIILTKELNIKNGVGNV
jgi:hypothetical protein